jgi:hypothetical protein
LFRVKEKMKKPRFWRGFVVLYKSDLKNVTSDAESGAPGAKEPNVHLST